MSTIIIEKGKDRVEFGVMTIPNRKSRALIKVRGAMVEPLAYFINDEKADEFEKLLDYIIDMGRRRHSNGQVSPAKRTADNPNQENES